MTLEEIRKLLLSGELTATDSDVIGKGILNNSSAQGVEYSAHCGWDVIKALACDKEWGRFNVKLLAFIEEQYSDEKVRDAVLADSSLEDHHWDWFSKAAAYKSDEYRWYFLYSEGLPQAACLIFHPKKSVLSAGNIFYVEYLAVAPWNRRNVMQERRFAGVGTRMLKHAVEHCRDSLNLLPGFSLHALPGAMNFYEKIGMLREQSMDKGQLAYYEMPESSFSAFAS